MARFITYHWKFRVMIINEDCVKDYIHEKIKDHVTTCSSTLPQSLSFVAFCYMLLHCTRGIDFNRRYNRDFLRLLVSPDPNESCCIYRSHDASSKAAALLLLPCLYTSKVDRATDKNIEWIRANVNNIRIPQLYIHIYFS